MRTDALAPSVFSGALGTPSATPPARKPALLNRLFDLMVKGQEARARAIVARHVALHDDATLKRLGWTEPQIKALRFPKSQ